MKEALIELRSNLFSGIDIDVNDKKIITKFKRDFPGTDLVKTVDVARAQTTLIEFSGILFSNCNSYHQAVTEIKKIDSELPELNLNSSPLLAYSYLLSSFSSSSIDVKKVQECCDHLDKRAKIAENKGRTESAGFIRQFSADCRKYLLENQFSTIRPIFGEAFSSVILEICKIKGSILGIIQLRDLAEKCFVLTKASCDNIKTYQLVMLLIALQCKDFKMEMPIASASAVCPFCNEKVTAGNVCENCGEYIKCPGCGTKLTNKGTCSGCGIEISKIKESVELLNKAEKQIATGQYGNIERDLDLVFKHWKKNERVVALIVSLEKVKNDVSEQERRIDACVANLQYISALQLIDKLLSKNDDQLLRRKKEQISNEIAPAQQLLKQGDNAQDWTAKIEFYSKALQICSDLAEATRNMSNVAIQTSTKLNVEVAGKTVRLSWTGFNSHYLKYIVIRKLNAIPKNSNDGEVLGTLDNCRFDDPNAVVGLSYYYAVYTLCGEAVSKDCVSVGPVLIIDDIDAKSFKYDIKENNIGFVFTAPDNSTSIEVFRDNTLVKTLSGTNFLDSNLTTDKRYKYKFATIYQDCLGKKYSSKGIEMEMTPTSPPKSVQLKVSDLNDKAVLTWISPSKGILEIYSSSQPFVENENDIIERDRIKGEKLSIAGNSYTANKNFNGIKYFLPVTVSDNISIAGSPISIVSILKPEGVSFDRISDRSIEVNWQWSNGIDNVRLSYTIDGGREQSEVINKSISVTPRKTVTLPKDVKGVELCIQTEIKNNNGEILLSERIEKSFSLQVVRISFLDAAGGGFFSKNKITIKVQANSSLPCDLHLLIGEGRTPIDLNNYKSYLTVEKSSLSVNEPKLFTVQYARNDKNKPLILRIIPSDMSLSKSMVITPETKQIK